LSNKTKKILLFGASGQVGQALLAATPPAAWHIHSPPHSALNIADEKAVFSEIDNTKPDLVINLAAMTNVDACEKNENQAREANFIGPANLAVVCAANDIPLIHLSTDYVFDGQKGSAYTENDTPHPVNHYGFTKMLGEDAVRGELVWHVIMRVSWVMSAYGENVLTRLVKLLTTKDAVQMVSDQSTCPTPAVDMAQMLYGVGTQILAGKINGFGTFHYAGMPIISRYDFCQQLADYLKDKHRMQVATITPCNSSDFPSPAKRPAHTALDCSKIARLYDITAPAWQPAMHAAVDQLINIHKQQVA
jgi:dTDP-4-dehydrorhamnose reductase